MKFRQNRYKRVKWIDTRFAKPYKMRRMWANMKAAQVTAVAVAQSMTIRASAMPRPNKLISIAELNIMAAKAVAKIYAEAKRPPIATLRANGGDIGDITSISLAPDI